MNTLESSNSTATIPEQRQAPEAASAGPIVLHLGTGLLGLSPACGAQDWPGVSVQIASVPALVSCKACLAGVTR